MTADVRDECVLSRSDDEVPGADLWHRDDEVPGTDLWHGDEEVVAQHSVLGGRSLRQPVGWGLFGNKHEDAAYLIDKAGNFFKLAMNWSSAAAVYKKNTDCHLQGDSKHEASAYVGAANCYKNFSPQENASLLSVP